jgi:hypothetical protein
MGYISVTRSKTLMFILLVLTEKVLANVILFLFLFYLLHSLFFQKLCVSHVLKEKKMILADISPNTASIQ